LRIRIGDRWARRRHAGHLHAIEHVPVAMIRLDANGYVPSQIAFRVQFPIMAEVRWSSDMK